MSAAQEQMRLKMAKMKEDREQRKKAGTVDSIPTAGSSPIQVGGSRSVPVRGSVRGPSTAARGAVRGGSRRGSPVRGRGGTVAGATGPNAARELNLVKAELKILKMKFDNEVRKREALERQLKIEKEKAASVSTNGASSSKNTTTRATMPNKGKRSSVKTMAPQKNNSTQLIQKVLSEMQRLEDTIKNADAQRNTAETELLEVAMLKQTADEALTTMISSMQRKCIEVSTINDSIKNIGSSMCCSAPQAKQELAAISSSLDTIKREMMRSLDQKNISREKENSFKRTSIFVQKLDLQAPPPPNFDLTPPPAPSGLPNIGPSRSQSIGKAGSRASTILTQIRRGKDLKQIDAEAIALERATNTNNCRQSLCLLSSLKDTLRNALSVRQDDMNLYGEDDDDWDD